MSYGKRERFYHSMAWKKARGAYLSARIAVDGGLCEVCRDKIGDTVHHKTWLTDLNVDDPDISLNPENFCLICRGCHAKEKNPEEPLTTRYRFGEDGSILPPSKTE